MREGGGREGGEGGDDMLIDSRFSLTQTGKTNRVFVAFFFGTVTKQFITLAMTYVEATPVYDILHVQQTFHRKGDANSYIKKNSFMLHGKCLKSIWKCIVASETYEASKYLEKGIPCI